MTYSHYVLSAWSLQVVELMYSNQELAFMHFMYSLADGDTVVADCTKKGVHDEDI
jgi:hypothetical protein